jgi:hypothetical protein
MGVPAEPSPAKYFVALLTREPAMFDRAENKLMAVLGEVDDRSEILLWNTSRYYEQEMGSGLLRRFVSFVQLLSPERLARIKLQTQQIEEIFLVTNERQAARRINIDPGYLERDKVVLASTKNAAHRIYLQAGIYGETTLVYQSGGYRSCQRTYPDYLWPEAIAFLTRVRGRYLEQLRHPVSAV